jgi:outer membrane protein assembly factor BamB
MPRAFLICGLLLVFLTRPATVVWSQEQKLDLSEFPKLSAERDWPWWRGPLRNGIASETPVPTKLSDSDNVKWKSPVPGRGHSSPIVVGDRVFLATADEQKKIQSVLAYDRATGRELWNVEANRGGFPAHNHAKNTEASPTLASDGERLFATFFHHNTIEAIAFDLDGKIVWQKTAGAFNPKKFEYGYAPSPLIYGGSVIVSGEFDGNSFLTALDRTSGKPLWKSPRPKMITFSSPVVTSAGGKNQLLISGAERVSAFDPDTGKPLWSKPGTTTATCGTMVWDGDIVFASGGYPKPETIALKADGSKILWTNSQKCYEQSMLAHNGHVYALTDGGILFCWRGTDGKEMWKQRLTGPVSASPVLAGGNIYWANELGTLYVFKPNPQQFELVAENHIGTDSFPSPAICGGEIFLRVGDSSSGRRQEMLYCFGK